MKIGSLEFRGNVFLAPMAGITDPPFRRVVQKFGVSAVWTEMISAQGLVRGRNRLRTLELEGHCVPTVFQISGNTPEFMAEATRRLEEAGASAIDINMGCPARKVVSGGAGAALMTNPVLAGRIVAAVRKATELPLTAKIRSGWDDQNQNAPEFASVLENEGLDAVIIHSRSRSSRHSGPASFGVIQEVKESVRIPVIGNGGIKDVADFEAMIDGTGCDGVMVGRGVLGRPWLLRSMLGGIPVVHDNTENVVTVADVIREHYDLQLESVGVQKGVRRMRKHLAWYSRGFPEGNDFRQRVFREDDPICVMHCVETFFRRELVV